jgi:hypothetical protein
MTEGCDSINITYSCKLFDCITPRVVKGYRSVVIVSLVHYFYVTDFWHSKKLLALPTNVRQEQKGLIVTESDGMVNWNKRFYCGIPRLIENSKRVILLDYFSNVKVIKLWHFKKLLGLPTNIRQDIIAW